MADDPEKLKGEDYSSFLKKPFSGTDAVSNTQREDMEKYVQARVKELQNASNADIQRALLDVGNDKTIREKFGYGLSSTVAKRVAQELEKVKQNRKKK